MNIFALLSNAANIATVLTSALAVGKRLDFWKKAPPHRGASSNIRQFFVGLVLLMIPAILVSWAFVSSIPPNSTPTPQPTQTAQQTDPHILGTYSGNGSDYGSQLMPWTFTLVIKQLNQQSFSGTYVEGGSNSPYININGTVNSDGNIQFTITQSDPYNGNQTITYTSTTHSSGGLKGTWVDTTNGRQGVWDAFGPATSDSNGVRGEWDATS